MIHGGAGALENVKDAKGAAHYLDPIQTILEHGRKLLQQGGSALDAVELCACMLEDDPTFNAGRGSVLNNQGNVEMDAGIMDGRDLSAGTVAAIHNIANPIKLARLVMTETSHVTLTGDGALRFAEQCGIPLVSDDYFLIEERIRQLKEAQQQQQTLLDHDESSVQSQDNKYGTVGAIARDVNGNLAAATSTGGIVNKSYGRVGDTPIIGSGVYADNETCAVSTTGFGEDFMRTVLAKTLSDYIFMQGMDASQATQAAIEYFKRRVAGRGGMIVIDHSGNCCSGYTTRKMIHGWIEKGGETVVKL